jgi:hypothetical protein
MARLTADDVLAIRASEETARAASERYGITPGGIRDIRNRRSWRHI